MPYQAGPTPGAAGLSLHVRPGDTAHAGAGRIAGAGVPVVPPLVPAVLRAGDTAPDTGEYAAPCAAPPRCGLEGSANISPSSPPPRLTYFTAAFLIATS
jgi:hypothetical protein